MCGSSLSDRSLLLVLCERRHSRRQQSHRKRSEDVMRGRLTLARHGPPSRSSTSEARAAACHQLATTVARLSGVRGRPGFLSRGSLASSIRHPETLAVTGLHPSGADESAWMRPQTPGGFSADRHAPLHAVGTWRPSRNARHQRARGQTHGGAARPCGLGPCLSIAVRKMGLHDRRMRMHA